MRQRISALGALLAAAVPGLLFAPVFGLPPLLPSIAVVLVLCFGVAELAIRWPGLRPWRPVLALLLGLLGIAEVELGGTTLGGLPTGATVRALADGATRSWQLTLQSTWPVRPEAGLLLFVPLLVLLASIAAVELLRWPALAALPGVAGLLLSQAFVALTGTAATVVAIGYAAVVAAVYLSTRPVRAATAVVLVPTLVLGVLAAVVVTGVDPGHRPSFTVQRDQWARAPLPPTVSPLSELAARLEHPDTPVFSYTSDAPVDRWRVAVLTDFDGVTWTAPDRYRRVGQRVPAPAGVTVPTTTHSATLTVPGGAASGPWLPSQAEPVSVTGAAPLLDPSTGALLLPDGGAARYDLSWRDPDVDPQRLAGAGVDPAAPVGDLGAVPAGVAELARTATGGMRPSLQAALVLERYLRENYRTAAGADLPTGSGWPQLRDFLLGTKVGTSEQFAAGYVVLARIVGIPARLAVGYRAPRTRTGAGYVVRDGDALAWPEVAVAGVGWVPLDPSGALSGADSTPTKLSQVTDQVRTELPPTTDLHNPPLPAPARGASGPPVTRSPFPVWPVLGGVLALLLLGAAAIPLAKAARAARRRRHRGARAVAAAWWEARDLLQAHGTPVTPGMTVRDLAGRTAEPPIVDGLLVLAEQVDVALWSGGDPADGTAATAWAAVRGIRRSLAARPVPTRVRALFDPRGLLAR